MLTFPIYWMLVTATGSQGSACRLPPHLLHGPRIQSFLRHDHIQAT